MCRNLVRFLFNVPKSRPSVENICSLSSFGFEMFQFLSVSSTCVTNLCVAMRVKFSVLEVIHFPIRAYVLLYPRKFRRGQFFSSGWQPAFEEEFVKNWRITVTM